MRVIIHRTLLDGFIMGLLVGAALTSSILLLIDWWVH